MKTTAGCGFFGPFESFYRNVMRDQVKPILGSVLKCDLVGGVASHSGIYIGNNRIVEVANVSGRAKVQVVSPSEFLSGASDSLVRTGAYIYVAAHYQGEAIGSTDIAERALIAIGDDRGEYNLLTNNCHMFTHYCISGEEPGMKLSEDDLISALIEKFNLSRSSERDDGVLKRICRTPISISDPSPPPVLEWASTGFGSGDSSF